MKIAIVGIGSIGSTLARKLVSAGHEVSVANSRGKEAVRAFSAEAGAAPCDLKDVFDGADAVIRHPPTGHDSSSQEPAGCVVILDSSGRHEQLLPRFERRVHRRFGKWSDREHLG